ncbi:MAG: aspartate-semialdehyde dehydrogenase [Armatimonadota bacterium]|nr:aspartate-semialdehyde dehydrogenase [Armatimonadota bacterium]MDR7400756.1 aspartate-semialdehyde dehydrogenase [Armatimonadota bacterium]MDR7404615.1 aspartate-semialdehyde dehydrogenase [Armatimonadota bacterium]MDR7436650.1 aspartate-semialdehyde dehydrogenase [Armatimonadota bacterium]MDR7472931.1 aspartate-semialdehyde dehydrogenase [Armatimonadota bacterium]
MKGGSPIPAGGFRVGIVGATGVVGREVLRVLQQRRFPVDTLRLFASERSVGRRIGAHAVEALSEEAFAGLDVVIFDTPDDVARRWVPRAAAAGATVIDNSAAFRMDPDVPLVIPEVNAHALARIPRRIVANPNCTTATIAVPLAPLHREAGLRRLVACSYQSVSGAGQRGVEQLWAEVQHMVATRRVPPRPLGAAFTHPIAGNLIPAIGSLRGTQFSEETKVAAELRKMLDLPDLAVGVTCVRVPTLVGHGVAVHAEFERPLPAEQARALLAAAPGVEVVDDPASGAYPTPAAAAGRDPCLVGRIRTDEAGMLAFFAVADNLRKGAALNAVQIAEHLAQAGLLASGVRS